METYYVPYTSKVKMISVKVVQNTLNQFIDDLKDCLSVAVNDSIKQWKSEIQKKIINECYKTETRQTTVNFVEAIDETALSNSIQNIINKINMPSFDIEYPSFSSRYGSGELTEDAVAPFLDKVKNHISKFCEKCFLTANKFTDSLEDIAKNENLSDKVFEKLLEEIKSLEYLLSDKENAVMRLERCLEDLERLTND
jgi:gas vesicle protein